MVNAETALMASHVSRGVLVVATRLLLGISFAAQRSRTCVTSERAENRNATRSVGCG